MATFAATNHRSTNHRSTNHHSTNHHSTNHPSFAKATAGKHSTMRILLFLTALCQPFLIHAQQDNKPAQPVTEAASKTEAASFPESWSGNWTGTLNIFSSKGKVQSVDMTIEIHKIDTSTEGRYTFGIIYGSKTEDWRPYELLPVAPERGIWRIDEKNTIAMESYLYGPKFLCWFSVQGSRVLCTYEKTSDDTMVFEVISGTETAISITGNVTIAEEQIPEVKTYPFTVFQRAVLQRQ